LIDAKKEYGVITQKYTNFSDVMRGALSKSESVTYSCESVEKHPLDCGSNRVDSNPVAFR